MALRAFEKQVAFFRRAFEHYIELLASQLFFLRRLICFWICIRCLRRRSISRGDNFFIQRKCGRAFLIGIGKSSHPIELGFFHEAAQFLEVVLAFAGKSDDK